MVAEEWFFYQKGKFIHLGYLAFIQRYRYVLGGEYEGEFKHGLYDDRGKMYVKGKLLFEGIWREGYFYDFSSNTITRPPDFRDDYKRYPKIIFGGVGFSVEYYVSKKRF
jgi:hypothetical protein